MTASTISLMAKIIAGSKCELQYRKNSQQVQWFFPFVVLVLTGNTAFILFHDLLGPDYIQWIVGSFHIACALAVLVQLRILEKEARKVENVRFVAGADNAPHLKTQAYQK